MNLAEFKDSYSPGPELREKLAAKKIDECRGSRSLVAYLAELLVSAAGQGIRETINSMERSGVTDPLNPVAFRLLPEQIRTGLRENIAAVVFGVSVKSLEDTLVNGKFDARNWCDMYNLAISGTSIPKVEVSKEVDTVSVGKLQQMYAVINEDKTFGLFFKSPSFMPDLLQSLIDSSDTSAYIKRLILPMFKERASFLII